MRKLLLILGMTLALTACGTQETMETIADEAIQAVSAQPKQIHVELPEEAALPAMESDSGVLYMCRDYDVSLQTLDGGDLQRTVRSISGCALEELTLMQTIEESCTRSEVVWTASGETGEQFFRAAVLDDGSYHYVLTAAISAEDALQYQEIWNGMFESFSLS